MNTPEAESAIDDASEADGPANSDANSDSGVTAKVARLFDLVPEIGSRWRWYDIPYRALNWPLRSRLGNIIPDFIKRILVAGLNFFIPFNEHERNKFQSLDDPKENLILPDQARLRQGGLWTVELFPPSKYQALVRALRRNGWGQSPFYGLDESNIDLVRRARDGQGSAWARIASVVTPNTKYIVPDAKRETLPKEFQAIHLTAVQLGTSVTAVVAFFQLSDTGESRVGNVWRRRHQPTLTWQWLKRPKLANRYFSAIEATQSERLRIHNLARCWIAQKCPGFFASRADSHPVLDLNVFDGLDPLSDNGLSESSDGFTALGMETFPPNQFLSPQLKGARFIPTDERLGSHMPLHNCWGIAGEVRRLSIENDRPGYGDKPYAPQTLAAIFDYPARAFVLYLAVIGYLREQKAVYAVARDLAAVRHRRFTISNARKLSSELLESGLDLPAVSRDCRHIWSDVWRRRYGIEVHSFPIEADQHYSKDFDLIEAFGKHSADEFHRLLEEDENYRSVLSTAAALGASMESARIGYRALVVAGASMLVAGMTLLVTEPGGASLWSILIEWLRQDSN